jgi:hypothetical protein
MIQLLPDLGPTRLYCWLIRLVLLGLLDLGVDCFNLGTLPLLVSARLTGRGCTDMLSGAILRAICVGDAVEALLTACAIASYFGTRPTKWRYTARQNSSASAYEMPRASVISMIALFITFPLNKLDDQYARE